MIVDFICRPSKAGKDGFSPLELSITIEGKRKVMSFGKWIKAKSFNPRTQKVRANPSINEYIEAVRTKLHLIEIEMIKKNLVITILHSLKVSVATFANICNNVFKHM